MWTPFYWILPLISAAMWLGMLLAMFISWEVQGHPVYASEDSGQVIAYISDIGAEGLKPLFNVGCIITTLFLDLAFISERYLRHTGQLVKLTGTLERVLVALSIVFAIIGTAGLILLSFFDTLRHPSLHRLFLLFFMGGYVISAICITWEYQRLGVKYRAHTILRLSFWIKLVFIVLEIILAIAFGVCLYKKNSNPGAVLEWLIALIFTFYILTFFLDLLPAMRRHRVRADGTTDETRTGPTELEMGYSGGTNDGAPVVAGENGNGVAEARLGKHTAANRNGYANGHANGHADGTNEYGNGGGVAGTARNF
ncbi:MAG: hypothetical protein M1838_002328 [Thelocarpon superellum]|nr:MAG: hypothetical protein M1838_002328 [Thelocarpon superellum]